jgi:hypothetical protein
MRDCANEIAFVFIIIVASLVAIGALFYRFGLRDGYNAARDFFEQEDEQRYPF